MTADHRATLLQRFTGAAAFGGGTRRAKFHRRYAGRMKHEQAVRAAVKEYNTEFATKGWVAISMGVLSSLGIYVFMLMACWVFFGGGFVPWYVLATLIFAIFFGVSWWTCSRGVDPSDGLRPMDEDDLGAVKVAHLATGTLMSPRHASAGAAGIVMHGAASILEGRSMLASKLPEDESTARAAGELLARLAGEQSVPVIQVKPPAAALVLVRTGLAKVDRAGTALLATVKGREAAS
jgi:hypothetical protein